MLKVRKLRKGSQTMTPDGVCHWAHYMIVCYPRDYDPKSADRYGKMGEIRVTIQDLNKVVVEAVNG